MAPLLSKVDLNKLWRIIQNEETVIYATFCKDLFDIAKVIGRKTKWPRFFGLPCMTNDKIDRNSKDPKCRTEAKSPATAVIQEL